MMSDRAFRIWYRLYAVGAGLLVFIFARLNRLSFPFPWDDEARFYLPALWWARKTSLRPGILHAPQGIFWVPDGFTLVIGLVLKLFGGHMEVARTACECSVAAGVIVFAVSFCKITRSAQAGVFATLLLITPPVVFAANMVRMEALLFLLVALTLLLHANGHVFGAAGLLFSSLLFHPALGLAAIGYALVLWMTRRSSVPRRMVTVDWAILATTAVALLLEAIHTLRYLSLFRAHMSYQLSRKLGIPLSVRLLKPQGIVLVLSCITLALVMIRWRSRGEFGRLVDVLPIAAMALGLLVYAVVGAEMAYDVYSLSVAPALVFCVLAAYVYQQYPPDRDVIENA